MKIFLIIVISLIVLNILNKARRKTKWNLSNARLTSSINKCKAEMTKSYNCHEDDFEVYRHDDRVENDGTALILDRNKGKVAFVYEQRFSITDGYNILDAQFVPRIHMSDNTVTLKVYTEDIDVIYLTTYARRGFFTGGEAYEMANVRTMALLEKLIGLKGYYPDFNDSPSESPYSMADELRKLTDMYEDGLLDEEEFTKAKARLLA
ncbi:SHOCT domain-containing protein [Priestia aryabhattai]|uniref:SHOCT domain-containing protein n=1 Tax=Priestia aryabhattai TaxID=412384 RepID=UPI00064E8C3E|nr:SHOCT domain-containing protein [Priestia aryabhattai]KML31962.1 hypothetical protein VL11_01995 [Priestia aryabhattai]KMN91058.1 hypothetical protein ABV89_27920 [Priestia aryabhattai]